MQLNFDINSNFFNPGYAIESENRNFLSSTSKRAEMLLMGDLPVRVDPRNSALFKEGWLQVEDQGQIGSCFKGDTLVTMANGSLKKISDIQFGEYVLSHNRIPRMVIDTMSREFSGKMYTIHVKGWNPITMTDDHIVPVKRKDKIEWVKARDILEEDLMLISSGINGSHVNKIDLSNYTEGLQIQEEDNNIKSIGSIKWINRYLELNDLAAYCIGLYVAEGSTDFSDDGVPSRACWTLNENEIESINKIKDWAELLGLECKVNNKTKSKTVIVRIQNSILASFLKSVCGRFSNKKQIPWFILNGNINQKANFIYGYFDGDGSYRDSESTLDKNTRVHTCSQTYITTANKSLQIQIASLCVSLGMKPGLSISKKRNHQNFDSHSCYLYGKDAINVYNRTLNKNFQEIGQWRKIRSISYEDVKFELVYDITVDVDHSFIADGIAVHNCQGQSLTECHEYCYTLVTGRVTQFSRMYAYILSQMFDNIRADNGSTLSGGTKAATQGLCLESTAPYPSRYPGWNYITEAMKQEALKYRLKSHTEIKKEEDTRRYIGSGIGIVQIGISWGNEMTPDSNGCIRRFTGSGGGGHAIVLCGYVPDSDIGQQSSKGYWYLLKNSWSKRWGKQGFAYVDPSAIESMLRHRWTVFIGRSDMEAPNPRPIGVDFTKRENSLNA